MSSADAIVVLGCTLRPGGVPSAALARRVALAARAYAAGLAPLVIASGGRRWGEHVEAVVMRRGLEQAGVPPDAVWLELCSLTTLENGRYTAQLMARHELKRAIVATCHWHLPRAIAGFRHFGVDAIAPPAAWLERGSVSLATHARERVCRWADAMMMRRQP